MYYPYLRAKQYELKALREFSKEYPKEKNIIPILEPVKVQTGALNLAINDMLGDGMRFALVLNPRDGDFKHATVSFEPWLNESELLTDTIKAGGWIPALMCSKSQMKEVPRLMDQYGLSGVMLIFKSCVDVDDNDLFRLINDSRVSYVVNAFGPTVPRRLKSKLRDTNKKIVRLDDCFRSRLRNADYALEEDEFFSEEPFYYRTDEGFDGFSDFTTLPSDYIEGGMLPYALVIHLSYKKNEDQLYVHHFVSDSNQTKNDIKGKFREAASKVEPFFADKIKTPSIEEIIAKAGESEGYPGLGYLKKLSIKNHLELVKSII